MSETSTLIGYNGRTIGREQLTLVPTPPATETHRPIPHHEIVGALIETLGFRHIGVVHDEYAVSPDGMKMFGVLDLATEMEGCRFSIGLRNSHDKSMRLAMTCGYRVFVCSNMAFSGDFTPVLAKHSKSFSLIDCISVGVDRMQRNFEPMRRQVEAWQKSELMDVTAKVVIYEAFVEGKLEAPKHLARSVYDPMENRGTLRLLVGPMPGQPCQRRQGAAPRYAACGQPSRQRTAAGCQGSDPQLQLSRRSVPSPTHQARCPKGHHGHAHRLARLVYRMLKYGQRYIDKGTEYYEQRYRNQQVQLLRKNATKLGFQITEARA